MKRQNLIKCVLTGNSKQYLGKAYTEKRVNKLSAEEVDKLFSNYKAKLLCQMVKSLGKLIIRMYSIGDALQRFTCKLYQRFDSFLATLSVGLITSRHYLLEWNVTDTNNGGTNGSEERDK